MRIAILLLALAACGDPEETDIADTDVSTSSTVTITTALGAFDVAVDTENAPITADNFLQYVDDGFYDGDDGAGATLFHRVIPGFMAQGGGLLASGAEKPTRDPIVNESDNGLSNLRGTIAMARTNDPNSATSQFFVNVVDNTFLDIDGEYPPGYAVFGTVTAGMDVVDAIVAVQTGAQDRPVEDIEITDCERQ